MSAVRAGRVVKSRRRPNKAVLRMMAIMTDGNKEELPKEFIEGGRTGRRNAMPDILHSDANVTTADLPDRLQQLVTSAVQSASSPSSDVDSDSSGDDSDIVLKKFLKSDLAARRNALCTFRDQATVVSESSPNSNCHSHECSNCCSQCSPECLDKFLKYICSQRREALRFTSLNQGTSVDSCDWRNDTEPSVEYIPRHVVPHGATELIHLDERKLLEMLNLNEAHPQPGPSSEPAPADANKDGDQKTGS